MILYHWTSPTTAHLGSILAEGEIRTTESNLSFQRRHAGPPVVWLTASPALDERQIWTHGSELKRGARLTVECPDTSAHRWLDWSREQGIDQQTYTALAEAGGDPESWWVTTRAIRRPDIRELVIYPFDLGDGPTALRQFSGDDLRALFRSAGRRQALDLPRAKIRQV